MLIGLTGWAGSGKDTVAGRLVEKHGFIRLAFADKLKAFALALDPQVVPDIRLSELVGDAAGMDAAKRRHPEVRHLLQDIGQAARETLGADFWVEQVLTGDVANSLRWGNRYVVTDVRYENEAHAIRDWAGEIWSVFRPGLGPFNGHPSEREFSADLVDEMVLNEDTIAVLHNNLDKLMEKKLNG